MLRTQGYSCKITLSNFRSSEVLFPFRFDREYTLPQSCESNIRSTHALGTYYIYSAFRWYFDLSSKSYKNYRRREVSQASTLHLGICAISSSLIHL